MKINKSLLWQSFLVAFEGIAASFRSERNFKIHVAAGILAIALGILYEISLQEWLWIALAISLVFASELLNTAIEALANLVSPDFHPLIKKTKDASAAAVLVMAVFALFCGLLIFLPKTIDFIF